MRRTYPKSDHPDKYLLVPSKRPANEWISPILKLEELCHRKRCGPDQMIDTLLSDISEKAIPGGVRCGRIIYDLPTPLPREKRDELRQAIGEACNAGAIDVPIRVDDDDIGFLLFGCCFMDEVYPWDYEADRLLYEGDRSAEKQANAEPAPNSEGAEAKKAGEQENVNLTHDMILSIIDGNPLKRSIGSSAAKRLVDGGWDDEVKRRRIPAGALAKPSLTTINRALGRRED